MALVTLVPALVLATVVAGVPDGAGPMALAAATGSAAYIGLFVMLGAMARRSAVWALAVVFLGERLLGGVLSGIAQISPMWETQQVYAGLADDAGGWRLLRDGTPNGWGAVVRLATILVVDPGAGLVAARPTSGRPAATSSRGRLRPAARTGRRSQPVRAAPPPRRGRRRRRGKRQQLGALVLDRRTSRPRSAAGTA